MLKVDREEGSVTIELAIDVRQMSQDICRVEGPKDDNDFYNKLTSFVAETLLNYYNEESARWEAEEIVKAWRV